MNKPTQMGLGPPYVAETACRICLTQRALVDVHAFGQMPLVNRMVDPKTGDTERLFPLTLARCKHCETVQLRETVTPQVLFGESYPYYSSSSSTMVKAMALLAHETVRLVSERTWGDSDKTERPLKVLEIASNDGYLLQHYKKSGHQVVGIEPADGPRQIAEKEHGIPCWGRFFTGNPAEVQALIRTVGYFDVIHAHNVVAHVALLPPFLRGIRELLTPQGVFVLEVPDFMDTLRQGAFDQVYHEHVFYFTRATITYALGSAGLRVVSITKVPLHGGSLRVVAEASPAPGQHEAPGPGLGPALEMFSRGVERQSDWLRSYVLTAKESGKRVAAYGASAKGCVRLMQARLGPEMIDFVADKTVAKHQKLMPGVRIPILPAEALVQRRPDLTLLLTWNFENEIRTEQAAYLAKGGRFLNPVTGQLR